MVTSPLHLAPPGPPRNFEAKVFSDTEIYLTWIALILPIPASYEICYNALTPVCVGGPVSMCMYVCVCMYVCMYVCVCMCVRMYACMYVCFLCLKYLCMCICMHSCIWILRMCSWLFLDHHRDWDNLLLSIKGTTTSYCVLF